MVLLAPFQKEKLEYFFDFFGKRMLHGVFRLFSFVSFSSCSELFVFTIFTQCLYKAGNREIDLSISISLNVVNSDMFI